MCPGQIIGRARPGNSPAAPITAGGAMRSTQTLTVDAPISGLTSAIPGNFSPVFALLWLASHTPQLLAVKPMSNALRSPSIKPRSYRTSTASAGTLASNSCRPSENTHTVNAIKAKVQGECVCCVMSTAGRR